MLEEKQGTIAEIIFHNSENGYTVAVFETETDAFTAVGNLPAVTAGRSYILQGEFVLLELSRIHQDLVLLDIPAIDNDIGNPWRCH